MCRVIILETEALTLILGALFSTSAGSPSQRAHINGMCAECMRRDWFARRVANSNQSRYPQESRSSRSHYRDTTCTAIRILVDLYQRLAEKNPLFENLLEKSDHRGTLLWVLRIADPTKRRFVERWRKGGERERERVYVFFAVAAAAKSVAINGFLWWPLNRVRIKLY